MNVFADYHHSGLYHSLSMLFEKRLGATLYSPVGREWFDEGYWKYCDIPGVIKEYLEVDPAECHSDGWVTWDRYEPIKLGEGEYSIMEAGSRFKLHRITLDQFKKMDFDYIVPSVYNHEESFLKLRDKYQPKAKLIRQFGNMDEVTTGKIPNLLNSSKPWPMYPDYVHELKKENYNHVLWRQEMDLEQFKWTPPPNSKTIKSLIAFPHSILDWPTWEHHKKALWDFRWVQHGLQGDNGHLPERDVAKAFYTTDFIWHVKFRGDGYGHTIHHAYACGRPCIVRGSYYKECLAEPLLVHDYSCIDLEKETFNGFLKKMRYWAEPNHLLEMSKNAYALFKKEVNFDKEFEDVKEFLAKAK